MSRIVFFNIPAHGHTNPTIGVVKELVSRGHAVRYYSYEKFREKIEAAGAEFIACDAYDNQLHLTPEDGARIGTDLSFSIKVLVRTALALEDMILHDMLQNPPDCIVGDSMAVWGKWIAEKLQIPFISSTTTFAFNRYSAKIMPKSPGQLQQLMKASILNKSDVNLLRKRGYPVKGVLSMIQNDNATNTIVYTSKEFQPYAETFSEKFHFVGSVLTHESIPKESKNEKVVYISMGTVNHKFPEFYQNCIEAFRYTSYRVIISAGEQTDLTALYNLPQHIEVYSYVDQLQVLQYADVFLTHCGMNSVSESLYYHVPMILFPQTDEQSGVAKRTFDLGAGVYLEENSAESILHAVETVMNHAQYRDNAEKIGKTLKQCGGAKAAANVILHVIEENTSKTHN